MNRKYVHPGRITPSETNRYTKPLICFDEASEMTMEMWELITKRMENMETKRTHRVGNMDVDQAIVLVGRRVIDRGNNNVLVKGIRVQNGVIHLVTEISTISIEDVNWEATDELNSTLTSELKDASKDDGDST